MDYRKILRVLRWIFEKPLVIVTVAEDKFQLGPYPMATCGIKRVELSFQLTERWFSNGLVSSLVTKILHEN